MKIAPTAWRTERVVDGRGEPVAPELTMRTRGRCPDVLVPLRPTLPICFVIMPFGGWFDRYYQEVYVPAIRAVGLEPRRADELPQSGCLAEQIRDHIASARVLLADLSGNNPNVCYEVGLAHALKKPVVLTAACIDEVPFDLRHLRIIAYDVRDPAWAERLRAAVVAQLTSLR